MHESILDPDISFERASESDLDDEIDDIEEHI